MQTQHTLTQSRNVATLIAEQFSNARFCGFKTYKDQKGKIVKHPLSLQGQSVGKDVPPDLLVHGARLNDTVVPGSKYWGVYMQRPIEHQYGILWCIDIDFKNAIGDVDPRITTMIDKARDAGILFEASHSGRGAHLFVIAPDDDTLPASITLAQGQEIELFGHTNASGKSIMLTGDEVEGELNSFEDMRELLNTLGIDDKTIGATANAPKPKALPTPIHSNGAYTQNTGGSVSDVLSHVLGYDDYHAWIKVGMAIKSEFGDAGFNGWDQWSKQSSKYNPKVMEAKWLSFNSTGVGFGTVVMMAQAGGYQPKRANGGDAVPNEEQSRASLDLVLERIRNETDVHKLIHGVVEEIKSAKGIAPEDNNIVAGELKKQAKKLGVPLPIADARRMALTDEQAKQAKARRQAQIEDQAAGRKTFGYTGGKMHTVSKEIADMFDRKLFYRGVGVVRLGFTAPDKEGFRGKCIVAVDAPWVVREVTSMAMFTTDDGTPIDCPERLAQVLVRGGSEDFYLPLSGVARAPFLRKDLSICYEDGYDDQTGIWLDSNVGTLPVKEHPTKDDAISALRELEKVVSGFPFAGDKDKAAWLADLLGAVARPTLDTAPATMYTAPMAGTGKTLLAETVTLIAYGSTEQVSYTNEGETMRKLIASALDYGEPYLAFDNVPNGLAIKLPVLAQILTAPYFSDRRLGKTEMMRFENHLRISFTGNNITPGSDMARRCLVINLDTNSENPRGRTFEIKDLKKYVTQNRAQLLGAVLTILRAYKLSGQTVDKEPLASFEQWSQLVQGAVIWLGYEDPVAAVTYDDDGTAELSEAFSELAHMVCEKSIYAFKAGDVARQLSVSPSRGWISAGVALEAAGCEDPSNSKKLGHWLKTNMNRVSGGFKLIRVFDSHSKTNTWEFKEIPDPKPVKYVPW